MITVPELAAEALKVFPDHAHGPQIWIDAREFD